MAYVLEPLPYAHDALEPFYDKATLEIHHGKHHATYVSKLNDAVKDHPELQQKPVEELLKDLSAIPEKIRQMVINHGGGTANHNLFWKVMGPQKGGPATGKIAEAINSSFGNYDTFKEKFTASAIAVFGSGWTWLVSDRDGKVDLMNTPNQDSPLSKGLKPVLVLDLWEHAYYLKFQNRRPEWISTWWNVVNWDAVNALYAAK